MPKHSSKKNAGSGAPAGRPTLDDPALRRRIAEKAYELYERRGREHGRDQEDWIEAERIVLMELKPQPAVGKQKPGRRTVQSNPVERPSAER